MKTRSALLFALTATAIVSTSAYADPPPWAPAHGYRAKQEVREYRYVYYPARQVYYEPSQGMWFWMNGGAWQFGVNLPVQYQAYVTSGVPVVLHSAQPYVEHVYVDEHYGRAWRERHGHDHDRDHDRRDRDDHRGHDDHRGYDDHRGRGNRDEHHDGGHGHHRD